MGYLVTQVSEFKYPGTAKDGMTHNDHAHVLRNLSSNNGQLKETPWASPRCKSLDQRGVSIFDPVVTRLDCSILNRVVGRFVIVLHFVDVFFIFPAIVFLGCSGVMVPEK